ncbi:MAG: phosphate signaling complex protein PhoU [bacterium]
MEQHIEREIDDLRQRLLYMGVYTERILKQAVDALLNKDKQLAEKVKENDVLLDRMLIEMDDFVMSLLAEAPLASDLRFVVMGMKISQNLERIGDEARRIANRAFDLADRNYPFVDEVQNLSKMVVQMVRFSMDAFETQNVKIANEVIEKDKEVDILYMELRQKLEQDMLNHSDNIFVNLQLINIAKRLERISDIATNIAEEVIYIYEAKDVRIKPENK